MNDLQKNTCKTCNGAGQVSFFQGVSRFLLTTEECPECGGLGFLPEAEGTKPARSKSRKKSKKQ